MNIIFYDIFCLIFLFTPFKGYAQYQKLELEMLPKPINSPNYDEITPVLSHDGQTLYFTRVRHPDFDRTLEMEGKSLHLSLSESQYFNYLADIYSRIAGYPIRNAVHSDYNQDIWIVHFDKEQFQSISHPGPPLNNALPNSICALTPEQNAFVILNQFLLGGGMDRGFSIIQQKEENWDFPQPMQIENFYTEGGSVNVTMSPDGEVLIMSLQRTDTYGQNDLYASFKNGVGGWTEPMNLGPNINSSRNEITPTISEDKKTLYFASNRPGTLGGSDIFRARRNSESWTDWSPPRRFVEPINSRMDDAQPYFNDATGYLYFTSKRAGSADIYRVKVATPKPDEVLVKGKVIHALTKELLPAKLLYGPNELDYFLKYFKSKDGHFEIRIPKGQNFKITAEKTGFLKPFKLVETKKGKYYPIQKIMLLMTPVEKNALIELDPIYFKQSEPIILEESYPVLDHLLQVLKDNPTISIRVEGHTENRGKPQDLQDLSEARAFAIKRYLLDRGIDSARIATIGYGATRPVTNNKTEANRQRNRRVEVRIVE